MTQGDDDNSTFQVLSIDDLEAMAEERERLIRELHPRDPAHPLGFKFDEEYQGFDIYWGGYEYFVPLDELRTPEDLLWKLHHLGKKTWKGMTPHKIGKLIGYVASKQGWTPYGKSKTVQFLEPRTTSDAEERALMTPKLRYDVLIRDNLKCRVCGASAETGAHLHIDHIHPISKGGRTEFSNLQALCSQCNLGKGARK